MNLFQSVKSVYKNYWNFRGRASRSEFWYFCLFTSLVELLLSATEIFSTAIVIYKESLLVTALLVVIWIMRLLFAIFNIIPHLFVAIRRLHDTNRSGWCLLIILTIIGIPIYLYLMYCKSDKGDNDYGPNPLNNSEQPSAVSS
ncbi:MAG: Inner membrane protein YhaI [Chlamydiae bacterium]|nr:Inner membrane protein YhaI [Chlamydiota bacterium]